MGRRPPPPPPPPGAGRTLPAPGALATGWVGDIGNSNCVGPFLGAALYVRARYQDIVGNYCVTMPMSTPEAVTFGREVYGEPKKLATIVFETQDDYVWGSAERRGIRFLSLRGRMTAEGGTGRVLCEVDPDAFMPYVFSKMDDFSEIAEGGVLQAQASRKTREGRGQWRAPK